MIFWIIKIIIKIGNVYSNGCLDLHGTYLKVFRVLQRLILTLFSGEENEQTKKIEVIKSHGAPKVSLVSGEKAKNITKNHLVTDFHYTKKLSKQ